MPKRSGKAKKKGRGRRTTDWYAKKAGIKTRIGNQTTHEEVEENLSNTKQQLVFTHGAAAAGSFTLQLGDDITRDLMFDATIDDVRDALKEDCRRAERVKVTGGPLGTNPMVIRFNKTTFPYVPALVVNEANLIDVMVVLTTEGSVKWITWKWSSEADWSDANSDRAIMQVDEGMELSTVQTTGIWRLAFNRTLYAFNHKFMYKLNAYSEDGQLLLRLTVPPSGGINVLIPGGDPHPVVAGGVSETLAEISPEIKKWVRFGVGEYWD